MRQEQLASICSKEAGRPLNVTTVFGMHQIDDTAFMLWARRRLLLALVPIGTEKCECCGGPVDDHAEHMIKCLKLGRGPAHYAVKTATLRVSREIARTSGSED